MTHYMDRVSQLSSSLAGDDPVLFSEEGPALTVTLNSTKTLNALSGPIIQALMARLSTTAATEILLKGNGKAFCAGGDVKHVHQLLEAGRVDDAVNFFLEEFKLDRVVERLCR